MLKSILKYVAVALVVQGILFVIISMYVTNDMFYTSNILYVQDISNGAKKIYGLITGGIKKINKHEFSALYKSEPGAVREQKAVWRGVMREPKLLSAPVWVEENKYFQMTDPPVSIRVANIKMENYASATIEIKYPDGRSTVFDKVKKGATKFIEDKYYVKLIDLKNDTDGAMPIGVKSAKIALYEKSGASNTR